MIVPGELFDEDSQIKKLLRLEDEPCIHVNEMQAHRVILEGCNEFMDRFLQFYYAWSSSQVKVDLPLKQVYYQDAVQGDFRVMPCVIPDAKLKFVKVIGTNEEEVTVKDKICVGKSLLIDYYDNHVYAILDVCALSSFRTAAVSVLAMYHSVKGIERIGLVGMGRIGFYTAYILYYWLGVRSFVVTDVDKRHRENFESLCAHYLPEVTFEVQSFDGVVNQCDALFLSTTSALPLINAENGAAFRFISSVGADADNLSELDATLLQTHRVITDSLNSMRLGDMKRWETEGKLDKSQVVELRTLIQEDNGDQRNILFISTGIAVQDVLINSFVFEKICGVECLEKTPVYDCRQALA